MKIHGNRVYLNMPPMNESKIEIAPELREALKKETALKFRKLTVFQTGEMVSPVTVKKGDVVMVDPAALQRATIIEIDGSEKICVNSMDIMHTWDEA